MSFVFIFSLRPNLGRDNIESASIGTFQLTIFQLMNAEVSFILKSIVDCGYFLVATTGFFRLNGPMLLLIFRISQGFVCQLSGVFN